MLVILQDNTYKSSDERFVRFLQVPTSYASLILLYTTYNINDDDD